MTQASTDPSDDFVSSGHLPQPGDVERLIGETYREVNALDAGQVSTVYPALAAAAPDLFGIAVVGVDGRMVAVGDSDVSFTIMSVAKPFVYALVCEALGPDEARDLIGINATGLPFNSTDAVERSEDGRTNAMVNAGAIATTSFVPGRDPAERWAAILDVISRFAGRALHIDQGVYASASATNHRNRELARLLDERRRLHCAPDVALDLYTRQCCIAVTARDLAVMGATLADGGVNPITGERVVSRAVCHAVLASMVTAGLYEHSGDWLHEVGVPGKSGIAGGIVVVSPGKGGLGTFAPPLDAAGNSVKGRAAARLLSRRLGLDLLASAPADQRG